MKSKKTYSLRFCMTMLLVVIISLLIGLMAYNNYFAYSLILRNVYSNTEDTLMLFQKHLDDKLAANENYLFTTAYNNTHLLQLKYQKPDTTEWYSTLFQLNNTLQNVMPSLLADGIFCWLPAQEQYISATQLADITPMKLKEKILKAISDDANDYTQWTLIKENQQYFFLRIFHLNDAYTGIYVSMDTLLNSIAQYDTALTYFSTSAGDLLLSPSETVSIDLTQENTRDYIYENIHGQKMLVISRPLKEAPFYLTKLIPSSEFSSSGNALITIIIVVLLGLLVVWLALFIALRKWITRPVSELTKAIGQLRGGNLKAYVPASGQLEEFQNMTTAFNDMVSEIENLKIDVYERQLSRQRLEAQYLKQQITPHFMINCLNTVYQLTETSHPDLAKEMLKDLSKHLRYTLSSGPTVPLKEEIALVRNYIEMSNIRYPNCIKFICDLPEELENASAIPLLLLNFAENTIKYEVRMGMILEIHIEITKTLHNAQDAMAFCIWDTGSGFSADMLHRLQHIDDYLQNENEHIGITNVCLRARHIYNWSDFVFTNRPGAGAQIDIKLPLIPYSAPKAQ